MDGIGVMVSAACSGNFKNFALQGFPIFSCLTWQVLFEPAVQTWGLGSGIVLRCEQNCVKLLVPYPRGSVRLYFVVPRESRIQIVVDVHLGSRLPHLLKVGI